MRNAPAPPDLDVLLEAWGHWQDLRAQDAPLDQRAAAFDRYVGARSRDRRRARACVVPAEPTAP